MLYIDKLKTEAAAAGFGKTSKQAIKWFSNKLKDVTKPINRKQLLDHDEFERRQRPFIGRMFMYFYDPKHKETLPYYDRFPLIFMVGKADGGFYGLNMHYLPPKLRALFFDKLLDYTTNKKYDSTTRLKLTYDLLNRSRSLKYFAPCFKHYLTEHVQSRIIEIPPTDWATVMFLPTEQFVKSKKLTVWADSKRKTY